MAWWSMLSGLGSSLKGKGASLGPTKRKMDDPLNIFPEDVYQTAFDPYGIFRPAEETDLGEGKEQSDVDWGMTEGPFKESAYRRDYWAPNAAENQYLQQQLSDIGQRFAARGIEEQAKLGQKGLSPTGTIGQFAYAQRVEQPRAAAETELAKEQYGRRWTGEQQQLAGQRSYTELMNKLAQEAAIAKQRGKMEQWQTRHGGGGDSGLGQAIGGIGSAIGSYFANK